VQHLLWPKASCSRAAAEVGVHALEAAARAEAVEWNGSPWEDDRAQRVALPRDAHRLAVPAHARAAEAE